MANEGDLEGIPLRDDSACPTFRTYHENEVSGKRHLVFATKKGDGMLEPFFGLDASGMGASG